MAKLGVNIDHVATIRQARRTVEPDPVTAAALCELAGCDSIVVHLREDRRHINDRDVMILRQTVRTRLNLEMSIDREIVAIARDIRPDQSTLVPEKRAELTTEGGLDVRGNCTRVGRAIERLAAKKIEVSLFIDPDRPQIEAAKRAGARMIELHTGNYAAATGQRKFRQEHKRLREAVDLGLSLGLVVNVGHGLTYQNVAAVAAIDGIEEFNIGHSIISRAVLVGIERAVFDMKDLLRR
ncbi:MAG: pyridoxine 5'-phosphate synthase [Candidatus Omnitrophota bacterium]